MGYDYTLCRHVGCDIAQATSNVFIRESMKSVSPDAFAIEMFRNRIVIGDDTARAMERRIEACDLN